MTVLRWSDVRALWDHPRARGAVRFCGTIDILDLGRISFFHWLGAAVTCTGPKMTGDRADYLGLMNGNEATNY